MTSEMTEGDSILIAEFDKNTKEKIRVSLREYRGNQLIDIRTYYPNGDGMAPGKGICMKRDLLTTLRKALQSAEKAVKEGDASEAAA